MTKYINMKLLLKKSKAYLAFYDSPDVFIAL